MKKYFSYVDTALRIVHINTDLKQGADAAAINSFFERFNYNHKAKSGAIHELFLHYMTDHEFLRVYQHEALHFWQTFFYPYLYYISCLEFNTIRQITGEIRASPSELAPPTYCINENAALNLEYQSIKFGFSMVDGMLQCQPAAITDAEDCFSLIDLIENATTIMQFSLFRSMEEEPRTPSHFLKWIKDPENKCYKNLYYFIYHSFGGEFAFNYLCMCVQLAFHTSEPITGFIHCVNTLQLLVEEGKAVPGKNNRNIYKVLEVLLHYGFQPVQNREKFLQERLIKELEVGFIPTDLYEQIVEQNDKHIIYHSGKDFHAILKDKPDIRVDFATDFNVDLWKFLNENMEIMAVDLNFLQLKRTNNATLFARRLVNVLPFKGIKDLKLPQYIIENIKRKDTTMSLLSETFSDYKTFVPRSCHFTDCPYFPAGLCWKWKHIPVTGYEDCRFPAFFESTYEKRYDPQKKLLVCSTKAEVDASMVAYLKMHRKAVDIYRNLRISSHHHDQDILIVSVDNDTICRSNYFAESISFIDQELHPDTIQSKIVLDFDLDMEEYLCNIPEVITFVKNLQKDIPHFLYYLNMSTPEGLRVFFDIFMILTDTTNVQGGQGQINLKGFIEQLKVAVDEMIKFAAMQKEDCSAKITTIENYLKDHLIHGT
ncbi:hypothetical protein SAMN05444266_10988 [Chitinophaga jiangningensis]|uniref:Uncharacterized protein n=1 Tax=Chitinophaga jiangningensis TaxID=1419482 RepID=A0A1M7JZZ1_9BACT|nr:hypothetical protein [Chitinophaga jiangningensis]SHM58525.1 hypothetical protein SAMN05444266_10988 [Chitinophaga jiangningensis]